MVTDHLELEELLNQILEKKGFTQETMSETLGGHPKYLLGIFKEDLQIDRSTVEMLEKFVSLEKGELVRLFEKEGLLRKGLPRPRTEIFEFEIKSLFRGIHAGTDVKVRGRKRKYRINMMRLLQSNNYKLEIFVTPILSPFAKANRLVLTQVNFSDITPL